MSTLDKYPSFARFLIYPIIFAMVLGFMLFVFGYPSDIGSRFFTVFVPFLITVIAFILIEDGND